MEIIKTATAGTLESSDIMITLAKGENGIEIDLTSTVMKQFGRQIRELIETQLKEKKITQVHVTARDRGALDCTIRARLEAALEEACKEEK